MKPTTITVTAKCSDCCQVLLFDQNKQLLAERVGYVPEFFPEDHFGDYIDLEIDLATGKILNWKPPNQEDIEKAFKGTPGKYSQQAHATIEKSL